MHRGTLLAGVIIGVFMVAIAAWMLMSPLSRDAYAATLRNARTGQIVTCSVRGLRQDGAKNAFDICVTACRDRGFEYTAAGDAGAIIDYRSAAGRRRVEDRMARFIPAACRDGG